MNDYLTTLKTEAWRTASARYWAARRLRRREFFSTVSLALFSAISVGIAVVQRIYVTSGSATENYLTALSGCLGVLLLTISLMEWGAGNGAKAEALHNNGENLNCFHRKVGAYIARLGAGDVVTWKDIDDLRAEYESAKRLCRYNHEPIDDDRFRAAHRLAPEFRKADGTECFTSGQAAWISIRWYLNSVWYFFLFWALVAGSITGAFFVNRLA